MKLSRLFEVLSEMHPLSEAFKGALERELIPMSRPKNFMLLEEPRIAEFAYFLVKGFAMAYHYVDGRRVVTEFWKSGQILVAPLSFFSQKPSTESIQLMDDSELLCISYSSVERLLVIYQEAHIINHAYMLRKYDECRKYVYDLQQRSVHERHESLLEMYRGLEQVVPQEYIASYLGITPQSLSRMKKKRDSN